jgi:cytochrome c biogenesis DsbD-like protein
VKLAATMFLSLLFFIGLAALPSAPPQVPSSKDVVSPSAYSSLEPVGRGSSFQLAVVLKIRNGFHINAREKSAEYLIATDLRADPPKGFTAGQASYPKGELRTFAFSKAPLNVYQDKVILRLPVTAQADAPLGEQHIPLKLRYQACSSELCLPPVTLDVDAPLTVVASASNSRPAHPELFPAR